MGTKREAHRLEPTKNRAAPRRLVFFDSESLVDIDITQEEIERAKRYQEGKEKTPARKEHNIYLIQASFYRWRKDRGKIEEREEDYYGNNIAMRFWSDVDRFCAWSETVYGFAHNARYDFQVTAAIPCMVSLGYRVESFSERPFMMRFEKKNEKGRKKVFMLLSSTNYYQDSLENLGNVFNLPKLDFDHGKMDLDNPVQFKEALVYGRRDVEILKVAMLSLIQFIEREELGKFCMTIASQSFGAFRNRFLHHELYIHADNRALEIERLAYCGGRTEAFTIGRIDKPLAYVDINSMYPYVMRDFIYPTKLVSFWETCSIKNMYQQIKQGKLVICEVLIDQPSAHGLFHKKGERLIFPHGQFWSALSTPEIIQALKRGLIKEIKNVCVYEGAKLFTSFVEYFYTNRLAAKAKGDRVHDLLFKLIMNTLYGKFGQKKEVWEKQLDTEGNPITCDPLEAREEYEANLKTMELKLVKYFGGYKWEKNTDENDMEAFDSAPAIAAHVTAYARMQLLKYIECAGWEHVHYVDTDSLFVDMDGYQNLWFAGHLDNKQLGKLKLEHFVSGMTIYGAKDYVLDYESAQGIDIFGNPVTRREQSVKIKGISKNAVNLGLDKDGHLHFAVTQWHGLSQRLRDGDTASYYNTVQIKTLQRDYKKGTLVKGRVVPHQLTLPLSN